MGNHFGGVVERVFLVNLPCRRLLALISNSSFLIPNWRQRRLLRAHPWFLPPHFVPLCLSPRVLWLIPPNSPFAPLAHPGTGSRYRAVPGLLFFGNDDGF